MHAAVPLISDLMDLFVDVLTTVLGTYYYVVALANAFFSITIDADAEAPVLWPFNVKNGLTGKDSDAGRD